MSLQVTANLGLISAASLMESVCPREELQYTLGMCQRIAPTLESVEAHLHPSHAVTGQSSELGHQCDHLAASEVEKRKQGCGRDGEVNCWGCTQSDRSNSRTCPSQS